MTRLHRLLLAVALLASAAAARAADGPKAVLVLYSYGRLLPAVTESDRGLRLGISTSAARSVAVFDEFLDMPRFRGPAYVQTVARYLGEKYGARPPDVIVAAGEDALDFLLDGRAGLFPGVPVVHVGVARAHLASRPPLPADVLGVPVEYGYAATMDLALRLHPSAHRLVVVTGAAPRDRSMEAVLRASASGVQGRASVEFLAGLPTAAVQRSLRALGRDAVVVTPGYFQDGEGSNYTPREVAELVASSSPVPVYGPFETFLGAGIVGGSMPSFLDMGRQAGQVVAGLLAGQAPATFHLPDVAPRSVNLDWRQVRRWRIDERDIPEDAVLHYRERTFLERYRTGALVALVAFLLQSALIAGLLLERRRRRTAERALLAQRAALAHASRLAVAGELTGAIAHQINQPLGAIQSNAEAAELLLESGAAVGDQLKEILADIRRDNRRASDVIRGLRALLARHEVERRPFDLAEAAEDAGVLLRAEAQRRRAAVQVTSSGPAAVVGDRIQIQQAIINLVLNALDAVADAPEDRRTVEVTVRSGAGLATVRVRDQGPGIAPEHLPLLFDSFFTTKASGMGLGLSIARTLVEAHGGTLRAESEPGAGATFLLELPVGAAANRAGADA